jgi:hypothetical protein
MDPNWGVVGAVGIAYDPGTPTTRRAIGHWCDPNGYNRSSPLPARVQSLDEQWLGIRRSSGLRFDNRLPGFHCYGVDLCLQAEASGLASYAIDAFAWHKFRKSDGKMPMRSDDSEKILARREPTFITEANRSYRYVGEKWRHRIPFFSTSMKWTDPVQMEYKGPAALRPQRVRN